MTKGYVPGFRRELNVRELGGYTAADGRKVKSGVFFRTAALGGLNEEELELLCGFGLRYVLDLRSGEEAEELPDPEIPGAQQARISGCMDADGNEVNLSPSTILNLIGNPRRKDDDPEEGIVSAVAEVYSSLAFDNVAYRELMAKLEEGCAPVLFHCTAGKDRTGVAAMVILMALGVDERTIIADYLLTNEYRREAIEEKLADHPFLSRIDLFELAVRAGEGVVEDFGRRVLDEIRQEYGTFDAYLEREFGLTSGRLKALRDKYLE